MENRLDSIINYDPARFADLAEVLDMLPEIYARALLNGLESQIRDEISRLARKRRLEERMKKNRSLKAYEAI